MVHPVSEKKDLNRRIGENIRTMREKRGLTQASLAEAINKSVQFISDMERGVYGISLQTLCSLCGALSCSADSLLFHDGAAAAPPETLLEQYARLSPADRGTIDRILSYAVKLAQ